MKEVTKTVIKNTQQSPTESSLLTLELQTPIKNKSAEPALSRACRRSSPRFKKVPEDDVEPSSNAAKLRRTPRNTKGIEPTAAVSPCATTTPNHCQQSESVTLSSPPTKTKTTRNSESAQHTQSTTTKSANSGVGRKNAKRKLDTSSMGPYLNVQLRDPNDTLADLQDEDGDEEDNSNHVEPDVEDDNGNDDEPDLENSNSSDNEKCEEGNKAKQRKYVPRGPTQMHALELNYVNPKRTVSFNANEQTIGDPSVQLASVLGVLVRKLSLTYRDWRHVPIEAKENIWKVVLNRFIVPDCYKDYYFGKMGAYLREARSRKAGLAIDAIDRLRGEERKKRLKKLMPRNMTVNEWDEFVKRVDSIDFRVKRRKMQEKRAKYSTPHTISRLGMARLEEALKKVLNTTNEIDQATLWKRSHRQCEGKIPHPGVVEAFDKLEKSQAEHGADSGTGDILAKAFGEDKTTGRVKGIGFGATRKKVDAQYHYKLMLKECQESYRALNDRLVQVEEKISRCVCNGVSPSFRSSPKASNNHEASTSRIVLDNERDSTRTTPSPVGKVQVPKRL